MENDKKPGPECYNIENFEFRHFLRLFIYYTSFCQAHTCQNYHETIIQIVEWSYAEHVNYIHQNNLKIVESEIESSRTAFCKKDEQ